MLQLKAGPRQAKAWERFELLGLPGKEWETYRYVRLSDLYASSFTEPAPGAFNPTPQENRLYFINGSYAAAHSTFPKPAIALPLSQAFKTYGGYLTPRLNKQILQEKDPFSLLNHAVFSEGLFLYFPPHSQGEKTLEIVHEVDENQPGTLHTPRIHIFAGKGAVWKLAYRVKVPHGTWVNGVVDLALEEGAQLQMTILADQEEEGHHFFALRATLKERSHLQTHSVTNGGLTSREDYLVTLQGSHANASLHGAWLLKNSRQHHVNVTMEHQEPHCISLQKFKGIVEDASRSSFEGKIYVAQKAQKTEAYQMNHNLVIGKRAVANSKPNLEIFADDVKASHGATVGQLDSEHLFYLKSRGIHALEARALLLRGFIQEITDAIPDAELKKAAEEVL